MMAMLQVKQIRVPVGQTVELQDVEWQDFEAILQELGEHRNTRIAYSDRILSIVAPLPEHEVSKACIGDFVKILLDELEIPSVSFGSTTFKNENMEKAVEPDDCFYINNYRQVLGKRRIDLTVEPPPDLAVEIEVTSKTQLKAYQGLGVPELWLYEAGRLRIDCLQDGQYVEVSESPSFPGWPIQQIIAQYVARAQVVDQGMARKEFRQWVVRKIAGDQDF
ncbi:MAG: Uma2 family endonuclease [Phormidesmis sp.]